MRNPISDAMSFVKSRFGVILINKQAISKIKRMPTVLRIGPYRFFFYAGDGNEPPHIHIERDNATVKFWLDPVRFQRSQGFSRRELHQMQRLVEAHSEELLRSWDEYFND